MTEKIDPRQNLPKRGLSLDEFCHLYGTGRTLAYEEIKTGRLRARKVGRRTVISRDDAESWLRQLPTIEPNDVSLAPPQPTGRKKA